MKYMSVAALLCVASLSTVPPAAAQSVTTYIYSRCSVETAPGVFTPSLRVKWPNGRTVSIALGTDGLTRSIVHSRTKSEAWLRAHYHLPNRSIVKGYGKSLCNVIMTPMDPMRLTGPRVGPQPEDPEDIQGG